MVPKTLAIQAWSNIATTELGSVFTASIHVGRDRTTTTITLPRGKALKDKDRQRMQWHQLWAKEFPLARRETVSAPRRGEARSASSTLRRIGSERQGVLLFLSPLLGH